MKSRHGRRGLALIEVLALLAVAVVLLAVLVSRLETSRELARREGCINHLKQLGLALHNYETANSVLPMSAVAGPGHGTGHSCFALLLPYLQLAPVYNAYNFSLENWHAANATVTRTRIELFLCPDAAEAEARPASQILNPDGRPLPGDSQFAPLSYGANWGGGHPPRWGADFADSRGIYLGVLMTVQTPDGREPGPDGLPRGRTLSGADIRDGAAYTVAMAEKRDSHGWCVGGFGGSEFDANPSPHFEGNDGLSRRVYTGSNHPDGLHVLLCDRSVRAVARALNREVWYALLTRAGGEAVSPHDLPQMADSKAGE